MIKLDPTYFEGTLKVQFASANPSLGGGLANAVAVTSKQNQLDDFIDRYELDALESVLGVPLANLLVKYINLKEGEEWTEPDVTTEDMDALVKLVYNEERHISFTANYVWLRIEEENVNTPTMRGVATEKVDKCDMRSNLVKQIRVYNEYVKFGKDCQRFVIFNEDFKLFRFTLPRLRYANRFFL